MNLDFILSAQEKQLEGFKQKMSIEPNIYFLNMHYNKAHWKSILRYLSDGI